MNKPTARENFWTELLLALLCSILGALGGRFVHYLFSSDPEDEEVICPACDGSGELVVGQKHRKKT